MENIEELLTNDTKVYVAVNEDRDTSGKITPKSMVWEDGIRYEIDEVLDIRRAASLKGGGVGLRYEVRIGNSVTYMWLEDKAWFVERK